MLSVLCEMEGTCQEVETGDLTVTFSALAGYVVPDYQRTSSLKHSLLYIPIGTLFGLIPIVWQPTIIYHVS